MTEDEKTPPVIAAGLNWCAAFGKEAQEVYPELEAATITYCPVQKGTTDVLAIALQLARRGLPVFPCQTNKTPACPGGFKAASADLERVKELWLTHPGVLIGMPTGEASGVDILDIDPRHGGDQWLNANRQQLPATRTHHTKSGGQHLLLLHHAGMRNSAGKITINRVTGFARDDQNS